MFKVWKGPGNNGGYKRDIKRDPEPGGKGDCRTRGTIKKREPGVIGEAIRTQMDWNNIKTG